MQYFRGVAWIFFAMGETLFENFEQGFLTKIAHIALFYHIYKGFNKAFVNLLPIWTQNANCLKMRRNLSIIFKGFRKIIAKIALF